MADISDLYPKPPAPVAPPQNGFGAMTPGGIVGLVSGINQAKLFQQQFDARQGVADAYRNNVLPDGSIDQSGLVRDLARSGFGAGEALSQGTANEASRFELQGRQHQAAREVFGSLADKPNLTKADVYGAAAKLARQGVPADIIRSYLADAPNNNAGLVRWATGLGNMAQGVGATSAGEQGTPTEGGAPQSITHGAATYQRRGVGGNGNIGMPVGLPPGEPELLASPSARAAKLQSTASTSPQYHADLENLRSLSKTLDTVSGPTAEYEKKLNQLAGRFGGSVTMTPDQLKSAEEFDKIANQISLNQSQLFHGSDASLHTVVGANPSLSMSKIGREGVIDMLQGNQDAVDQARKLWIAARANGAPASSFDLFMERVGQELDPRVFQFNRMSRENQQKFLSAMDPADIKEFEQKYQNAIDKKWVKPLKPEEKKETGGGK